MGQICACLLPVSCVVMRADIWIGCASDCQPTPPMNGVKIKREPLTERMRQSKEQQLLPKDVFERTYKHSVLRSWSHMKLVLRWGIGRLKSQLAHQCQLLGIA
jgi:hypothetical protein